MAFPQPEGHVFGERRLGCRLVQIKLVNMRHVLAGEPMAAVAQEVVAHHGVVLMIKDTHVPLGGGLNGGPIVLKDVVPMQVDVVKATIGFMANGVENQFRRAVCREPNVPNKSFFLQCTCSSEAAIGSQ